VKFNPVAQGLNQYSTFL